MKTVYSKLGEKKFKVLSIAFALICDLSICYYLYEKFSNYVLFKNLMELALSSSGLNMADVPPDFINEQYQLVLQTLKLALGIFLLFHLFNYTFFMLRKKFAYQYIKLLSWVAAIGCPLIAISAIRGTNQLGLIFFPIGLLYLFIALGLRKFPFEKKEDSPLPDKN